MRYFHASTSPLAAIKKYTKKQLALLVVAFVFAFSSATSLFLPTLASALPKNQAECEAQGGRWDTDDDVPFCSGGKGIAYAHRNDPAWLAQSYWRYKALEKCLNDSVSFEPAVDNGRAASGNIFMDNIGAPKAYSFYGRDLLSDVGDDGVLGCASNSSDILSSSLGFWGINGIDLACDTGIYKRQENADCRNGTGYGMTLDRSKDAQRLNLVKDFLRNNIYGDGAPSPDLNNASSYVFYRTVFEKGCAYNIAPVKTNPGGDRTYEIANIEGSGNDAKITPVYYVGDKDKNYGVYTFADGTKLTCGELASRLSTGGAYATAYLAYVKGGGENTSGEGGASCTGANPAPSCGSTEPVCAGGTLGWLLCPLNNLAADITGIAAEQIQKYLEFQPLLAPGNTQGAAIFRVWQIIIGIANILLVIAFLVVVFSQATSIGLSSYGIKKILPRIIAAAILMNISYFLCAVAVDGSNIIGQGMKGIISLGIDAVNNTGGAGGIGGITPKEDVALGIVELVAGLLVLAIALNAGAIGGLLVILATVATVLFTVFILLVIRQILIVLLIILAPLAFVAMVLPNTADLFTKWRKLFVGLLLLFPITMALLYGGIFVSNIILRTAPTTSGGGDTLQGFGIQAAALIAIIAPLFGIPAVFKRLLGAAGRLAGFVNNPNKGLIDRARKFGNENAYTVHKRGQRAENKRLAATGSYKGLNPLRRGTSFMNRQMNRNRVFNAATGGFGGFRTLDEARQGLEDQKKTSEMLQGDYDVAQMWIRSNGGKDTKMIQDKVDAGKFTKAQQLKIQQMRLSGLHQKASSFSAAMATAADSGAGTEQDVQTALNKIDELTPNREQSASSQAALTEYIRSKYRGSGRGDMVVRDGILQTQMPDLKLDGFQPGAEDQGWNEVSMSNLSRHGISAGSAGRESFKRWMGQRDENLRKVVASLDSMEGRARVQAEAALREIGHTDIDALRVRFGLRQGGGGQPPQNPPTSGGGTPPPQPSTQPGPTGGTPPRNNPPNSGPMQPGGNS